MQHYLKIPAGILINETNIPKLITQMSSAERTQIQSMFQNTALFIGYRKHYAHNNFHKTPQQRILLT